MGKQSDDRVSTILKNYRKFADGSWSEVTDGVHTVEEYHEALENLTKDYVSQLNQHYADLYRNKIPEKKTYTIYTRRPGVKQRVFTPVDTGYNRAIDDMHAQFNSERKR